MTKKELVKKATEAAMSCLPNFERASPADIWPRLAVYAAKEWLKNPTKKNRLRADISAHIAKYSVLAASDMAAEEAAWSAFWAACSVAWIGKEVEEATKQTIEAAARSNNERSEEE